MKTSKIIGIVICVLIPLIITGFIANYAYKDPDNIMGNKGKWERHYLEEEYGSTMLEKFTSSIQLKSAFYNTVPVVNEIGNANKLKVVIFSQVLPNANTVLYTGFLYGIDFTRVEIDSAANLEIVFANENIDLTTLDDEDELKTSASSFYEFADIDATIKPEDLEEDEDYKAYAYTFSFSNVAEVIDDTITFRIDLLNDNNEYEETLFGSEEGYKLTNIVKNAQTFENMMKSEGSTITTGLSGDAMKFGKGYNAFIWPTVLWISAVALVVSGGLSYLFYAIWTSEDDTNTSLPRKNKNKKEVKKGS